MPLKGRDLCLEVKARTDGFRELYSWLTERDVLIVKADHQAPVVVVRLTLAAELAGNKGYVGKRFDSSTSLQYLHTRHYDLARGQFTAQDPAFRAIGNPLQLQAACGCERGTEAGSLTSTSDHALIPGHR
jgi:RHS repeat-associated protein